MPVSLDNPLHRELYDYWCLKRGSRAMPGRQDIDPIELKRLLPHLLLTDVIDGGKRFRFRLVGTAIQEAFGRNMTGFHIDEVMTSPYLEFISALYRDIVEKQKPIYSESTYYSQHTVGMRAERLMLPLASDGATVDMVVSIQTIGFRSAARTISIRLAQEQNEEIEHLSRLLE